jgi:hypothetical protein
MMVNSAMSNHFLQLQTVSVQNSKSELSLSELSHQISELHRRYAFEKQKEHVHRQHVVEAALELGKLLRAVKRRLPHGAFTRWVRSTQPFKEREAQRYMRFAVWYPDHESQLKEQNPQTVRQCFQLTGLLPEGEDEKHRRGFESEDLKKAQRAIRRACKLVAVAREGNNLEEVQRVLAPMLELVRDICTDTSTDSQKRNACVAFENPKRRNLAI